MLAFAPLASVPIGDDAVGGTTIDVGFVSVSLASASPVVSTGVQVTSPAANTDVSPSVPAVFGGASVYVGSTNTVLDTVQPVLSIGDAVAAPSANISVSVNQPLVVSGASVSVPDFDTSISGQVPEYANALPVAATQLTPVEPDVFTGVSVAPDTIQITVEAKTPSSISTGVLVDTPPENYEVAATAPVVSTGVLKRVGSANIGFSAVNPRAVSVSATVKIVQPRTYVVNWRRPVILTASFSERRIFFVNLRQTL